ncbi:MAG: hypothetical protein K9H64_12545 [Bacteroidales bacterium]|nr:hypothetical protein [Bacteroidales bacterium]MCF8456874.1 hypothetical protein [Bacteroidales bacterium]
MVVNYLQKTSKKGIELLGKGKRKYLSLQPLLKEDNKCRMSERKESGKRLKESIAGE